jgi:hypothetical protein
MDTMAARSQRPLELILARNLLTSLSTPAPDQWISAYGPFGDDGEPMALDDVPTTRAIRDGRPAHGTFRIRSADGGQQRIASSAFPIVASEQGSSGAMIFFWPADDARGDGSP